MMCSGDEYDEKGRKVSEDPNYKSGRINVCGKTYPLVRKGWDVYIWKPEYQDATYTWTWKKDCDKYLFAKISLMPDYVRRYKERKENERLERNKKFVKGDITIPAANVFRTGPDAPTSSTPGNEGDLYLVV